MTGIIIYFVCSIIVAISNLKAIEEEKKVLFMIDIGQIDLYKQEDHIINIITLLFFPSILIQYFWIRICKITNKML